jgi:hypothetical protein
MEAAAAVAVTSKQYGRDISSRPVKDATENRSNG